MNSPLAETKPRGWLNRNVIGMSVTSFLSDAGHEMVTAVLPGFLSTLGVAAAALGWIEGISDAASSFVKLGAGWYSDRIGARKGVVTIGYFLTGTALALFALAASWPLVLVGRTISWLGRGIRGPLRDALLSESVDPAVRGKAFGLHRAGDTLGAVVGPLLGIALLAFLPAPSVSAPFRVIFVLSLIPGLASVVTFALFVKETKRAGTSLRFVHALREMPTRYRRFLRAVGLFGAGDFSPTLLILAATQLLGTRYGTVRAAELAALLYAVRNVVYAGASFPIGIAADRMQKNRLLAFGYGIGAVTTFFTAWLFVVGTTNVVFIGAAFLLAGLYIAAEDALEGAIPADLIVPELRGVAYGVLGTVNGVGDLIASVLVGTLWTAASPAVAFAVAGVLMAAGAILMADSGGRSR
jgi:MFS family permease